MAVYKDKNGTWYVSARYTNWKGEADRTRIPFLRSSTPNLWKILSMIVLI